MSNTIQKPDANPIVAALLTWFVLGTGHYFINGQQRKWLYTLLAGIIGSILCCVPGIVVGVLSVIDSYQTAERLERGEAIPENEYTNATLYKIVSYIDKTATCSRA
jgi:TM2 domain-containing membrane protein YozV